MGISLGRCCFVDICCCCCESEPPPPHHGPPPHHHGPPPHHHGPPPHHHGPPPHHHDVHPTEVRASISRSSTLQSIERITPRPCDNPKSTSVVIVQLSAAAVFVIAPAAPIGRHNNYSPRGYSVNRERAVSGVGYLSHDDQVWNLEALPPPLPAASPDGSLRDMQDLRGPLDALPQAAPGTSGALNTNFRLESSGVRIGRTISGSSTIDIETPSPCADSDSERDIDTVMRKMMPHYFDLNI
uniref:(California timema) hypothetical protein n=1 Tax=Timema californicum TaxID=61474 RepID=A0A7R9P6F3_TIMCA|nr:unnamed protein product [Timema californicum]